MRDLTRDLVFDNGVSGLNFERPQFSKMLEDIENGKIDCVIVKDLSRFGKKHDRHRLLY